VRPWYLRGPVATSQRITVLGGNGASYDVFEVVSFDDKQLVVRGLLLFEVGERLRLAVERDGAVTELGARVESHTGTGDDVVTRLAVDG
jgi:hypothetical protein